MEFETKDLTVVKEKLKMLCINVRSGAKGCYIPYFMVKYGDARDIEEIIDIIWDYDIETVAKQFAKLAADMGLSQFKIIDGTGLEYTVDLKIEEPQFD